MKEQIKTPKTELRDEEIANLSDAQFKTMVIRMLTEMVEYDHKKEEKVKAVQSEIKKNIQRTNSKGKETRTQINDLDQKEEINIRPEQNEETRLQKMRVPKKWDPKKNTTEHIIIKLPKIKMRNS